jgi:hypothetical protein
VNDATVSNTPLVCSIMRPPGASDVAPSRAMPWLRRRRSSSSSSAQPLASSLSSTQQQFVQWSRPATAPYGDAKVANRGIRVWHGATEKGP